MITIATNLIVLQPTFFDSVTKPTYDSYRSSMQHYNNNSIPINNQYYFDDSFYQSNTENWSERVLQDITGLLHVLSPTGKVLYCSESCIELTGYHPNELVGRMLTDFLHIDDLDLFIQNFRLAFSFMSRIKVHYRIRCKDNSYLLLESIGQPKQGAADQAPQSFFAIAQPYLSRSNGLLDSFLELKTENDRLKKHLNELVQQQQQRYHSLPLDQQQFLLRQQQQQQQYYLSLSPALDHTLLIPTTTDQYNNSSPQASPQKPSSCSSSTLYYPESNTTGEKTNNLRQWNQYNNNTPSVASIECKEIITNDILTTPPIIPCSTVIRKEKWKRRVSSIGIFLMRLFTFLDDNRRNIEDSTHLYVLIVEQLLLLNGEKVHMGQKRKF
jgi:PAS domain S-box-containing protein